MIKKIIGKTVTVIIDRPAGSRHPEYRDMIYPINYGYVKGVFSGDGEEQDVYVLGTDKPLERCTGRVTAVYRRFNDNEDKWIVCLDGTNYTDDQILEMINFQERFFKGELLR